MGKKIIFQKCNFNNIYFLLYIVMAFINHFIEYKLYPDDDEVDEYKIEDYISIRSEIDKIISSTSKHVSESEKFLEIYKYIGDKYKIVEKEKNNIKTHKCDETELVDLFQACLECAEIQSNIISGEDLENNRNHVWNQVKLEGKWYNTDLVGDMEYIKKKKTEYCLLSDKTFFKTHTPKSGRIVAGRE